MSASATVRVYLPPEENKNTESKKLGTGPYLTMFWHGYRVALDHPLNVLYWEGDWLTRPPRELRAITTHATLVGFLERGLGDKCGIYACPNGVHGERSRNPNNVRDNVVLTGQSWTTITDTWRNIRHGKVKANVA